MTKLHQFVGAFLLLVIMASCDHNVAMETTVHEDGSLDKKVTFKNKDSASNIMGLTVGAPGWKKTLLKKEKNGKSTTWSSVWEKSFASASVANDELDAPSDTSHRVGSTFEKKFRWFYTYVYYADTYRAVNRLDLPITDYVTLEDYAFIERLPAEGKKISKADSLYLARLNEKLFDHYGTLGLFEKYFAIDQQLLKDYKLDPRWSDTLRRHKWELYDLIRDDKASGDEFMLTAMEKFKIPLPYDEVKRNYKSLTKKIERQTNFMSTVSNGKYAHRINMPWTIVLTNADSLAGKSAYWKPPVIKFLIKDYTMYAEARKANWWAFVLSGLIVAGTVYVLFRKR